ncbi:MAG: precorrin-2 C(20)-methyltransferase [Acidimicrobiales bacterium]
MNPSRASAITRPGGLSQTGRLFGVGVGPGDPDLMTRRSIRVIEQARVVAHFAARGRPGNSLRTVEPMLRPDQIVERLEYPVTTESVSPDDYRDALGTFYAESAVRIADHLDAGRDVAIVSEGDPMFYGSYMHLHVRLAHHYETEVVPGVTAFSAACAAAGTPVVSSDEQFTVLPGILPPDELTDALRNGDAAVIMKVGRNLPAVTEALRAARRDEDAVYVERASLPAECVLPIADADGRDAPYFSIVLVPGRRMAATPAVPV